MRVFVLNSGRCGSYTFSQACQHATNYTAGHETAHERRPSQRLDYPDDHIEVDLRLAWLFGALVRRYPDAFWVHLRRDPELVADSVLRRWRTDPPTIYSNRLRYWISIKSARHPGPGIAEGFGYPILGRRSPYSESEKAESARLYVETINTNIVEFLRDRPHVTVDLETADEDFPAFWDRIGAEGDLDAALREFKTVQDQSPS